MLQEGDQELARGLHAIPECGNVEHSIMFGADALHETHRPRETLWSPEESVPGLHGLTLFEHAVAQEACGRLGRTIREVAFEHLEGTAVFVNVHPKELTSRWLVRPDDPIGFYEHDIYLEVTEAAAFEYFDICMSVQIVRAHV